MRFSSYLCAAVLIAMAGCGPSTDYEAPTRGVNELMADWHGLAEKKLGEQDVNSARIIAANLAGHEGGIEKLLDVLADPNSTPDAKILVVMSLEAQLPREFEPRLAEFTEPGLDGTTRACATQLLSGMGSVFAKNHLRELLEDESQQVRMAATVGLLDMQVTDIYDEVKRIWDHPETRGQQKTRLILVLPDEYAFEHLDDYAAALLDPEVLPAARAFAAGALARSGSAAFHDALKHAAENDPDEQVRNICELALEASGGITIVEQDAVAVESEAPQAEAPTGVEEQ